MSDLVPSMLPLDKGLNLQIAPILSPVGSISDILNYEQVDFQGQRRIDGYARYDGQMVANLFDYAVLVLDAAPDSEMAPGDIIETVKGFYGVVLDVEDGDEYTVYVAVYNPNNAPSTNDPVSDSGPSVVSVGMGSDIDSIDAHYARLLKFNNLLRSDVTALPGPVAGLHWFRDRLYAIANLPVISLDGTSPAIQPLDRINDDLSGESFEVVKSVILSNSRLVWLNASKLPETFGPGSLVTLNTNLDDITVLGTYEDYDQIDIASFFDSRTEQQVLDDEDDISIIGWRHKPTGWVVHFEAGNSKYGELTAINQHPDTSGEASFTSTDGDEGKALSLSQKPSITNLPPQVNGWKTSTFPTVYSLETAALDSVDDYTIYADAFIEWDSTGVRAPGADGINLEEYSATATVEVDV